MTISAGPGTFPAIAGQLSDPNDDDPEEDE
jgi:hypothetical protein